MAKKICIFILLLAVVLTGFSETMDNFQKGGMEFGGDFMLDYKPDYAIFNGEDADASKGSYDLTIEGSGNIGIFPADNMSVNLIPTLYFSKSKSRNLDDTFDINRNLMIGLNLGFYYYTALNGSMVLSPGVEAGITIIPGLDRVNNDVEEERDSLNMAYVFKPAVTMYYFTGEHLAPYIKLATQFSYYRTIKNTDGSDYEYPEGYSMFDDVYLDVVFTLGFKYFLPEGNRFLHGKKMNIVDIFTLFS